MVLNLNCEKYLNVFFCVFTTNFQKYFYIKPIKKNVCIIKHLHNKIGLNYIQIFLLIKYC